MKYIIEVLDERDLGKKDAWSHFSADSNQREFAQSLLELQHYIADHTIIEVTIKIERK